MESVWRRNTNLTKSQQHEKLIKDREYELAVDNLYATEPRTKAQAEKKKLWETYTQWAKTAGIDVEVTPQQQLAERVFELEIVLSQVNMIRSALNMPEKRLMDVIVVR